MLYIGNNWVTKKDFKLMDSEFKYDAIPPTCFRIGNLIFDDIGRVSQVSNLSLTTVEAIVDDDGSAWTTVFRPRPIPISDEFLKRFGFDNEYTKGGFRRWQKGDFKILDGRLPHPQFHHPSARIMFVHELQNLYFCLTNHELK